MFKVYLSIFYHSNPSHKILDPVRFLGHANCLYFRDDFGTVFLRNKLCTIRFLSKLTASQNRGLKLSVKIDRMSRFLCYDFQHQLTLIKTLWPSSVFLVTKSSFKLKESRRFYLRFFTRKNRQFGVVVLLSVCVSSVCSVKINCHQPEGQNGQVDRGTSGG